MVKASSRNENALVLGANGGIGGEVARQLRDAGYSVRALVRKQAEASVERDGMTWLRGDAMNREDVQRAAQGCSVIVHAVNPPGYRRWAELVLPMIDNTIAAAITERATIVLPGTVYNYGPDAFPLLREGSPQQPKTRKGAIRVELERRLSEASRAGARVIVVRSGDYFGPRGNGWFTQGMIQPGKPLKTVRLPSDPGVGHQWAYLPDVARTMITLLKRRDSLEAFATFHMAGHWDADGTELAQAVCRVAARHGQHPKVSRLPWTLFYLAAPFVTTVREILEMRYLWRQEVRLDGSRLRELLGSEPHTPLEVAIEETLRGQGCLGELLALGDRQTASPAAA